MTQQIINIGTAPNDGTGDSVRTAFNKVNSNFAELYRNSNNTPTAGSGYAGSRGYMGYAGSVGYSGSQGPVGPQGIGIRLLGRVATYNSLPTSGNSVGDAWFVAGDSNVYLWDTASSSWSNIGQIVGYSGSQGQFGYTGSRGAGYTGSLGYRGSAGAVGYTGSAGAVGYTGSASSVSSLVNGTKTVSLDSNSNLTFTNGEQIKTNFLNGGIELYRSGDNTIGIYPSGAEIKTFVTGGAKHTWTFGTDGKLAKLDGLTLTAGGQFNICTIVNAGSGYNTGSALKATTGGSGTGMTVGIGYGLSNQLANVTVVNPGTGYVNGDVITVSEGTGGTFTITRYNAQANQANNNTVQSDWIFGVDGKLTSPGNLQVNGGKIILNTGGNAYVESVDYGVNSANSAVNIFGGPYQKIKLRAGFGTEATWTFGTNGVLTVPGDILASDGVGLFASLVHTTNNMWNVDPSRTDTYTANGSVLKPFKTIAAALAYIEAKIADSSLTINISGAVVDNPQFIFLKSSITENVTLTRGNIFIVGETPDAGHIPIWINGYVTITPANTGTNAINVNRFGLFHVSVRTSSANHSVQITGTNPAKLYLQDLHAYQNEATKSCVYADNTGAGSRVEMYNCTLGRASGSSVYLIDIQRGFCSINNLETNGIGQVLNMANDSTGNMLRSGIEANTGAVVTLSGSAQWGMGVSIITNTGTGANTYGISMSGTATMQFGVCTFNVPAAQATNRAINGVAGNMVLYADPIFQYGSTNKISTAITLVPLTKTFTAA